MRKGLWADAHSRTSAKKEPGVADGSLPTEFEPAGRDAPEAMSRQLDRLKADPLMMGVANGSGGYISILNSKRQIIFANKALSDSFGVAVEEAVGQRPGELMGCRRVKLGPDGCGTSRYCSTCGAGQALRQARLGQTSEHECRILREDGDPLDLKVTATPFSLDDEEFVLFSALDISDEKRRQSLERIFFHDIMNTATGVRGLSSMARVLSGEERDELLEMLEHSSDQLIGEIAGQRELLAAEKNELVAHPLVIDSKELLSGVSRLYETHAVAATKTLAVDDDSQIVGFVSDPVLLGRVIGNLVKNALESTSDGGKVTLRCTLKDEHISFSVHNDGVMREATQRQIFQRSFTTKGEGRGLGTYGSRLLTQRYLDGEIWFDSNEGSGTTFTVRLPFTAAQAGRTFLK